MSSKFNLSPSVNVTEHDETLFVQEKGDTVGALPGTFNWGPVEQAVLITGGPKDLVAKFNKPTNSNYLSFCVAEDFLSYTNKLWVYRMSGANAKNAVPVGMDPVYIKNEQDLEYTPLTGIDYLAKYPGSLGNGLVINICDQENFPSWEFKKSFDYAPQTGEYSVVVLDGSGKWSGTGATRQQERLLVTGKAIGGVQQIQTLSVAGTATGGIKQKEILTVTGTATTNSTLVIDGTDVVILANDSTNTIATKIATALSAVPTGTYDSVIATANKVTITFTVPNLRTAITSINDIVSGVSVSSIISIQGNSRFSFQVLGKTVYVDNGFTPTQTTTAIKEAMDVNSTFVSVTQLTATTIKLIYAANGLQTTAPIVTNGLTITTTVNTPGDSNIAITVMGRVVNITNGDTPAQVASKVALVLSADASFSALYTNIFADRSSVVFTHVTTGLKSEGLAPATQNGLTFDVDVVVIGRSGTILEKYELLTNTPGDKFFDGTAKYFVDAIAKRSSYIAIGDSAMQLSNRIVVLAGGVDDNADINVIAGFKEFSNAEKYDINYLIAGAVSPREQKEVFSTVDTRRDCLGFTSPQFDDVINNKGNEASDVLEWREIELNRDSSYVVTDDNWGYYYDQYNSTYRWIPTCGGTAGLKARCDTSYEPWTSPAIFENAAYKNYAKLAWSSTQEQRDLLYPVGINSVIDVPGEGIRLFGSRTTVSRPTAFRNINVRSAFIVAEKSIANFSKYYLFKNNTAFTRKHFLNEVNAFLNRMKSREAFEDFKVICNESNNDATDRQNNELNAKFLLKPMYDINFIYLDFVAVGANISFEEIESTGA